MVQTGCEQVPPGCWNWLWLGQTSSNWFFLSVETGCDCLKVVVTVDGLNWTWLWLAQTGFHWLWLAQTSSSWLLKLAVTGSNWFWLAVETGSNWFSQEEMVSNWLWTGSSWLSKLAVTSSNWLKPVLPGCWNCLKVVVTGDGWNHEIHWLWLVQTGSNLFTQEEMVQTGCQQVLPGCWNWLWLAQTGSNWLWLAQTSSPWLLKLAVTGSN